VYIGKESTCEYRNIYLQVNFHRINPLLNVLKKWIWPLYKGGTIGKLTLTVRLFPKIEG